MSTQLSKISFKYTSCSGRIRQFPRHFICWQAPGYLRYLLVLLWVWFCCAHTLFTGQIERERDKEREREREIKRERGRERKKEMEREKEKERERERGRE
jgi:hypothetical protein